MATATALQSDSLADILERVLDKGLVIAGDISVAIADIELLKIKIRLVICSIDKARSIGLDWWERDGAFSSAAQRNLESRIELLEAQLVASAGTAR